MRKIKFILAPLLAILIIGLLLSGCGTKATTTTPATQAPATATTSAKPQTSAAAPTTQTTPAPQKGGTLRIGYITTQVMHLGYPPDMVGETDSGQGTPCLEPLILYDENFNLVPNLATGWKASDDGKAITLTLRKGVKFHDGSDFNAAVAKWNLENYRNSVKVELKSVASVDVIDDYTIRLNLTAYDCMLLPNLANGQSPAGIMISQKAFDTNGKDWCDKHPTGTGPFKFVSWEKDVAIKYQRFDQYWQAGLPNLDNVEIHYFANDTTAAMAFSAGEVDTLHIRLEKDAKDLEAKGYKIVYNPFGPLTCLAGDSIHPNSPFANIKVRQAVSYSLDLAKMAETLSFGVWKPLNQWSPPGTPTNNPNVVGYPYNPDKAKQLLSEAGYPTGLKTKLIYCTIPMFDTQMTAVQAYLKASGIDAELVPLQLAAYNSQVGLGPGWDNSLCQILQAPGPNILFSMQQITAPGSTRFISFTRPPEFQDLLAKALQATDEKTRNGIIQEMNKVAVDKNCMVSYLWNQPAMMAKTTKVHDDLLWQTPGRYLSPKAWLSK